MYQGSFNLLKLSKMKATLISKCFILIITIFNVPLDFLKFHIFPIINCSLTEDMKYSNLILIINT